MLSKVLKLFLTLNIFFIIFSAFAQASSPCPQPAAQFAVNVLKSPIQYDYTQSSAQLSNGSKVGGHMKGNTKIDIKPQYEAGKNGCRFIKRLDINIATTATLRVASNYKQGSCEYNVVKAHELKHLKVMDQFFAALPASLTPMLKQYFNGKTGFSSAEVPQMSQLYNQVINDFNNAIRQRHAELQYNYVDRPDLVRLEQQNCRNW